MIPLTFLKARMPLAKFFSIDGQRNYPLAKRFTSYQHEVEATSDGMEEFAELLKAHAKSGHGLFKGQLKEPLEDESRAGKAMTNNPSQLLVIDIDKLQVPNYQIPDTFDRDSLVDLAERVLSYLPNELQNISYTVQASASLGLRKDKVSLHFYFWLDEAVPPQMLKWWLTHLNEALPTFRDQLELTPTGHAISFPLDRCMAENSRIVYIAPPGFDKVLHDPFGHDPDARIAFVRKERCLAELSAYINKVKPAEIQPRIDEIIKTLRDKAGLATAKTKLKMVRAGEGIEEQLLINPDRAVIQYAYHGEEFCYANLNDGDSNAYYWPLQNPRWVYNFKDEPVFEMAKVDPDFYQWYLKEFRQHIVKDAQLKPLVFRDFVTDAYYTVEYDPLTKKVERFSTAARQSLQDFCADYWEPLPDPIPTWDTFFDPSCKPGIDFDNNQLNLFYPGHYMQLDFEEQIPEDYQRVQYGYAKHYMDELTPNIANLIMHVAGNGAKEFEHFVNWLAYAFKERTKTNIAWIFHGIEGTGKGILFHRVLQPLFGKRYAVMKRINDLEDNFDGWREFNLLTVIDEFRLSDTSQQSRMHDKLKNMISEPYGSVRYMRANAKEVPLYSNHIFFSNSEDAMRLSATDRRFCVAPRQMTKVDHAYDIIELLDGVDAEMDKFASFLATFDIAVDHARVALDNAPKQEMRAASNTWVDDFCTALKAGNYEYFVDNALLFQPTKPEDQTLYAQVRRIIAGWAVKSRQIGSNTVPVNAEDLRIVYYLMSGKEERPASFLKILSRRGMQVVRDPESNKGKVVAIRWDFSSYDLGAIIQDHAAPDQKSALAEQTH